MESKKLPKRGTRDDVWNDRAEKTRGGLTKTDLILNSKGKVVSRKRQEIGKKLASEYFVGSHKKVNPEHESDNETHQKDITISNTPKTKRKYTRKSNKKEINEPLDLKMDE